VLCEDYGVRFLKKLGQWDASADWAATTSQLSVGDHVNDLKGFARWTDAACSKTVNLPNDYPFDKFKSLYLEAYNTGYIKGITTYRSGTMTSVLSAKEDSTSHSDEEIILDDVKLPDSADASMKTLKAEGRKWYMSVVWADSEKSRPFGLFVHTNHSEKSVLTHDAIEKLTDLARRKGIPEQHVTAVIEKINKDDNASKIARMVSLNLRHGVLIKNIVHVLDGVENAFVGSFIFQIKKYLASFIKDGEVVEGAKCSECGGQMVFEEGCSKCTSCGNTKCG
jgi:ribonucleoside-diphosphate reductase alpha chain